jgi:hypothetical protein
MMWTEIVPEMLVIFNQLKWLIAQEDLINFGLCESLRSYTFIRPFLFPSTLLTAN